MQLKKRMVLTVMSFLFACCLWGAQAITSEAEETEVPGYHVYTTTEDEAIDTWYGIARGTYLQSGTSGIKRAGAGKMSVSGTTLANSSCDKVKVGVYLDESSNGGKSYGTIGSYYFEETNTTSCHGSKADIPVTSGWYYRTRCGHSVTEGSTTETATSSTTWLRAT